MKKLLSFIIALGLFLPTVSYGAIAFDSAAQGLNNTGSATYSYTPTSTTNGILLIGVQTAGITPSSVTYNGVTSTLVNSLDTGGATFTKAFLYKLLAPSSGTHNIVVNTGSGFTYSSAVGYTGVDQTNPIDVSATTTINSTSITGTLTTTVNNDWLVGYVSVGATYGKCDAGTNTTFRIYTDPSGKWGCMIDSGGARSTGSNSIQALVNSGATGMNFVALEPVQSTSTTSVCRIRLIGRCH